MIIIIMRGGEMPNIIIMHDDALISPLSNGRLLFKIQNPFAHVAAGSGALDYSCNGLGAVTRASEGCPVD